MLTKYQLHDSVLCLTSSTDSNVEIAKIVGTVLDDHDGSVTYWLQLQNGRRIERKEDDISQDRGVMERESARRNYMAQYIQVQRDLNKLNELYDAFVGAHMKSPTKGIPDWETRYFSSEDHRVISANNRGVWQIVKNVDAPSFMPDTDPVDPTESADDESDRDDDYA